MLGSLPGGRQQGPAQLFLSAHSGEAKVESTSLKLGYQGKAALPAGESRLPGFCPAFLRKYG